MDNLQAILVAAMETGKDTRRSRWAEAMIKGLVMGDDLWEQRLACQFDDKGQCVCWCTEIEYDAKSGSTPMV